MSWPLISSRQIYSFHNYEGIKLDLYRRIKYLQYSLAVMLGRTYRFFQHPKLVEKVVSMFDHDEPEIKREICWVLSNIGHCGNLERLITFFQQYQIMRMYSQALNFDQCQDLLENALESLGKILNYGQRCKIHQVNVMLKAFENYNGH